MYSRIAENKRKTVYLMVALSLLIIGIGYVLSVVYEEPTITLFVGIGALVYTLFNYFMASRVALRLNHAQEIQKSDNPRLYNIVENLSITAGMPMPTVHIVNDPAPNAFATGRDPEHAHVAATTGLLEMLDDTELEGVMAHELSHVANYDIRVTTIVFGMTSVISIIADIFMRSAIFGGGRNDRNNNAVGLLLVVAVSIVALMAATLIKFAVSRQREFLADASGAQLTRYPQGLASALQKISSYSRPARSASSATAHMYFDNPLKKSEDKQGFFAKLFSTHPPTHERVERLSNLTSGL